MFRVGEEYERGNLLNFVGSKQLVSGMIWGNKETNCIILTSGGKHGESAGYSDSKNYDGSWHYIGQGGKGDQDPHNIANSNLTNGKKTVLLFSTREPNAKEVRQRGSRKKFYRFEGVFEVGSWTFIIPDQGTRAGNKLIQYHLLPAENIFGEDDISPTQIVAEPPSIYELREKIKGQGRKPVVAKTANVKEYRQRSLEVKEYAILRAKGICEYCGKPAPFINEVGVPFLEVHHIFSLSDDGPDEPENVAAICPNCHREAHYGLNKKKIKKELAKIIQEKELLIESKKD